MAAEQRGVVVTRSARDSERVQLSYVFSAAMLETRLARWLISDRDARRARLPRYVEIWIDHCLTHGVVEVAETPEGTLAGLAIWQPDPGVEPKNYQRRLAEAVGHEHLPRFDAFDAAIRRQTAEPGWLGLVGVPPAYQRRGYATAVLRRRHQHLDRAGIPICLLAASSHGRLLLVQHGYRDCGPPIVLPDGPRVFAMRRCPTTEPNA